MSARKKKKAQLKLEGKATKVRRAEDLRALFEQSENTSKTPTPTPTVPTGSGAEPGPGQMLSKAQSLNRAQVPKLTLDSPYQSQSKAPRIDLYAKERQSKTPWWLGPALMIATALMVGVAWLHLSRDSKSNRSSSPQRVQKQTDESLSAELQSKIEFYRSQLGHRLNRSRVDIEIENSRLAPRIELGVTKTPSDAMMAGAPIMPEGYGAKSPRDRLEPASPDNPDARVQYSLQEEQHREEWQRRANQQFVKDFIENARREGVDVTVDKDLNVISVSPLSNRQPGSMPSSSR